VSTRTAAITTPRAPIARVLYAALATVLVLAIVLVLRHDSAGWWLLPALALTPDVALLLGVGRGLAKGQLHPRAVGLYNALHRLWGPLLLAALALFSLIPAMFAIGALVWAFHIAFDRALGYGLRTRDGFQRA
jgi:hypothetical protein